MFKQVLSQAEIDSKGNHFDARVRILNTEDKGIYAIIIEIEDLEYPMSRTPEGFFQLDFQPSDRHKEIVERLFHRMIKKYQ